VKEKNVVERKFARVIIFLKRYRVENGVVEVFLGIVSRHSACKGAVGGEIGLDTEAHEALCNAFVVGGTYDVCSSG
jgi:hypothetical protein